MESFHLVVIVTYGHKLVCVMKNIFGLFIDLTARAEYRCLEAVYMPRPVLSSWAGVSWVSSAEFLEHE